MDRLPRDPLSRWLAAEDGPHPDAAEAESALAELLESLPDLAPRPGFAARVMVEVVKVAQVAEQVRPAAAPRRDPFASWWLRLALAASLLATGLALPWVRPVATSLLPAPSAAPAAIAAGTIRAGADLLLEVGRSLATALDLGGNLLAVGRALSTPFANPPMAILMAVLLLFSAGSFRALHDLITRERSWSHADPI